jgi:hypothetical protein
MMHACVGRKRKKLLQVEWALRKVVAQRATVTTAHEPTHTKDMAGVI